MAYICKKNKESMKMKKFLSEPQNIRIMRESILTGILVFLFLELTLPFNLGEMHQQRMPYILVISALSTAVTLLASAFTAYVLKMPMDPKLPLNTVHRNTIVTNVIIVIVLPAVLVSYCGYYFSGDMREAWLRDKHLYMGNYFDFLYYVATLSIFVYIGTYVRSRNWNLRHRLEEEKAINALLEKRQNYMAEREAAAPTETEEEKCRIVGNANNSVLEVAPSTIIYVESMANYADVCYMDGDEPRHKMMRITLKQIMETLADYRHLVHCHRAFVVNLNFVVSMSSRNTGYQLEMFGTDKLIPVSRNNTALVKERLAQ